MNATSLYVSTSKLVFQTDGINDQNWRDLYRLVPYLRQALSCTVCSCLLIEPFSPISLHCQHHVCRLCLGGRKILKPACGWCKDYEKYEENVQLRILLQCYKSLCEHILTTPMYTTIQKQNQGSGLETAGFSIPNLSLIEFLEEGAKFIDVFKSKSGLSRSAYSILPCVFPTTNQLVNVNKSETQDQIHTNLVPAVKTPEITCTKQLPIKTVSNGSAMYSVLHTGIGNKITIKRKTEKEEEYNNKNITRSRPTSKRRGCRCGNATSTPGKLTCCGQRCPCYVESKPCVDCKCRGCRNPHRPDGAKIRPHIPELACYEIQMACGSDRTHSSPTNNLNFYGGEITTSRIQTSRNEGPHFTNQICQPIQLDNLASESLLISSPEGKIQVLNLFASSTPESNNLTQSGLLNNTLQNSEYDFTTDNANLAQILIQNCHSSDPLSSKNLLTTKDGGTMSYSSNRTRLNLSTPANVNSNNVDMPPLLVNRRTNQLTKRDQMSNLCSLSHPLQSQALIDLVVSTEANSSNNLNV